GGTALLTADQEVTYRRVASTLESFVQTSTLGEFRSRLGMLHAFACHLHVRRQQPGGGGAGPLAAPLAAALDNLVRYYGQFVGAVEAALTQGMAPLEKDLQDFVQLARWDDRGYYAMRASTEKAQRYLHRLSRRAEEVLRQPAATALATADKAMGVGELAAAAAAAEKAYGTVDEAAATAADGAAKEGAAKAGVKRAPRVKKLTPEQAAAEAEAMDLAGTGAAEASAVEAAAGAVAPGDGLAKRWSQFCAGVQQSLAQDAGLQQALTAASATLSSQSSSSSGSAAAYLPRLPQLAARLARVVGDSLQPPANNSSSPAADGAPAPQADADGADPANAPPELMSPDELAAAAIMRSHELRTDVSKGARMRKRQALADLYEALEQQGLSRRRTGVPPHDRDVAAWFKHPEPAVAPLWHAAVVTGGTAEAAEADALSAEAAWTRADDYYFRSMARLQKLWRGSQQPHRDLSMQEVSSARRLSEHVLYVARRQRGALGEAAVAFASLSKLAAWMAEEGKGAGAAQDAGAAKGAGEEGVVVRAGVDQSKCIAALQRQKERLDELALL
ncbi:hypothetical protein Agub_g2044, partial [Astrephomene gubernaculifera]